MMTTAVRFLILTGILKAMLGLRGKITYIKKKMTWFEARNYCREHYTDLYSGYQLDVECLINECTNKDAWIGLYKDANNTWMWASGNIANVFNRLPSHYDGPDETYCVAEGSNGWRIMRCHQSMPFYCFKTKMILVKENKTWEEAWQHCRTQHNSMSSPVTESSLNMALHICRHSQTENVWIKLRYLAGRWLSKKSQSLANQKMPECPALGHNCGAISTTENTWINWDCAAKLNFICL